jgi:ATP-dependent helicase/nuclease subunit A
LKTFIPIDAKQRERIRTDLDSNLCVEAGAGTGKTTVLVARIVEILRRGHATVDEIAVMTFTEAAAAELSARVRQELEDALAETPDGQDRERIHAALQGLHRAHVETIHAFATSLLRERPVEAGIDPGFEVLDDLAAQVSFDEAYSEWLLGMLAQEQPEIVPAIRRGFDLEQIRQLVRAIHRFRSLLPLRYDTAADPNVQRFGEELARSAVELRELLPRAADDENGFADMERLLAFADRISAADGDEALVEGAILFNPPKLKPTAGTQASWDAKDDCRRCKELRREVRDALNELQAGLRTSAIAAMLPLAATFVTAYEEKRKADGKADFDDLLEWARDLLATSADARDYFRGRFRTILVDEFQDTDPVQAEIALCIASDDKPGKNWLGLRPRPGSLTVVGDPKQSIYRFRRADIAVYDAVRHGPLDGGEVQLVQNFRSVGGVLSWVNETFDRVLVEREGVQPANTPLVTGTAVLPDEALSVCVVHGEPQDRAAAVRAEEARLLASTVRRAIDEAWLVRDRSTGKSRPARYGDAAVLVPRRTELDTYVDAFTRAEIPLRAEGGRAFFQRQEVRDLSNLLQAIDDPLDQVALIASLRSVALACSDEEIYLHTAAGNRLDFRLNTEGSPDSIKQAMALLKDLHDLRSRVSLAQLVRAALEKTRLVEITLAGWNGAQAAANLVKLGDQARAFSASGAGGLRAFARWLAQQRGGSDVSEASVTEETDDVVRLLTIHSAKGLEFPIVALANLSGRPRTNVTPVPDRTRHKLNIRIKAGDAEFKTPGFDAAWTAEESQQDAEDKRLLYVAATRARDHLIVPVASAPTKPGPMLFDLLPSLPPWNPDEADQVVDGCYMVNRDTLPALSDDEPPATGRAEDDAVDGAISEREHWETERATIVRAARNELEVFPATRDEGDDPIPASLVGADDAPLIAGEGPPREKGEALHKVLELVNLRDPHDLQTVVSSVCTVAGLEEHADEIRQMAEACLGSEALARALQAEEIWREVPYTLLVEGGYATGRIDLVFRDNGGLVVLDWKSDSVSASQTAAAADLHRTQASDYVRALETATQIPVKEIVFVFARAGGVAGTLARTALDDHRDPAVQ